MTEQPRPSPPREGRESSRGSHPLRGGLGGAVFVVLLAAWTWRLCSPISPELRDGMNATGQPMLLAKAAHVVGYAVLAALAVGQPRPRLLVGLLALHGAATEFVQTFVPGRSGQATDVLIDCVGIALGVLAVRPVEAPPVTDPELSDTRQFIVEVATTAGPLSERYDTYEEAVARVEALPAAIVCGLPFIFHELPDGSQRLVRNDLKPLQWHRLEHEQDVPLGDDAIPLGDENDIPEAVGYVGPRIKPITRPAADDGAEEEPPLPLAE